MVGGGNTDVQAGPQVQIAMTEILVASKAIEAGRQLTADSVTWEAWPQSAVKGDFITKEAHPDLDKFVEGAVTRAPLVDGEPVTETKFVRAENASFMAATLTPGNRAISIPVEAETAAGGFILPNDRVDVILTVEIENGEGGGSLYSTRTILRDVRVLAIDQIMKQEDDQQAVVAKTATLEVSPREAELVAQADDMGTLAVALRALGDDVEVIDDAVASLQQQQRASAVNVIRYGLAKKAPTESTQGAAGQ
jgi:pilus assembly protein CpaB